jgi:hypothetical protein
MRERLRRGFIGQPEDMMAASFMLFYHELQAAAEGLVGPNFNIPSQNQRSITSLKDMRKEIDKLGSIDELVIFLHGAPGALILEDDNGDVRQYSLNEDAISQAFASTKAQIKRIFFEGCSVGEDPKAMADFGRLFKATEVSGFTWFHGNANIAVTIPKGIGADDFRKYLDKVGLARWLPPSAPSTAALASMAREHQWSAKLWLEWFQVVMEPTAPYADRDGALAAESHKQSNFDRLGRHDFAARGEAVKRTVAAKDAKKSDAPRPSFEYVTVSLSGKSG